MNYFLLFLGPHQSINFKADLQNYCELFGTFQNTVIQIESA